MSVYIKGMEMPTRCEDCFCYRHNAEYDYAYCNISSVKVLGNANERLNNCPLVPVPEHGRTIDADALAERFWDNQCYFTEAIKTKLQTAPTIIPADKEGDG